MKYSKEQLHAAHKISYANKTRLSVPQKCGCFYCLRFFSSEDIVDWSVDKPDWTAICPYCGIDSVMSVDKPDWTAICPYCGIDSVIGENDGYPLTEDFLEEMFEEWFG